MERDEGKERRRGVEKYTRIGKFSVCVCEREKERGEREREVRREG